MMYSVICYLSDRGGLALSLAGVTGIIVSVENGKVTLTAKALKGAG